MWLQSSYIRVFLIALLSRLAVLLVLLPFVGEQGLVSFGDGPDYLNLAHSLTYKHQFMSLTPGLAEATRVPGYPFLLAVFISLGLPFWLFSLLQIIAVSFTPVIAMHLSRICGFSSKIGYAVGLICALTPLSVFYSVVLIPDALGALLFIGAMYLLVKFAQTGGFQDLLWSAILVGMMNYLRPIGTYFYLVIPAFLIVYGLTKISEPRRYVLGALVFGFTSFAILFPWMVRNHKEFGYFGFSSGVGRQLYEITGAGVLASTSGNSYNDVQMALRQKVETLLPEPRELSAFVNQDILLKEGVEIIKSHPGTYLRVYARSMFTFFASGNYQYVLAKYNLISFNGSASRIINILGRVLWLFILGLVMLGIYQVWRSAKQSRALVLLTVFVILYLALVVAHITVGVEARHRFFIVPFYSIFMAFTASGSMRYVQTST